MDRTTVIASTGTITVVVASAVLIFSLSSSDANEEKLVQNDKRWWKQWLCSNKNSSNDQTTKKQTTEPHPPSHPPSMSSSPSSSSLDTSSAIRFPWEPKIDLSNMDEKRSLKTTDQSTHDGALLLQFICRNEMLDASPTPPTKDPLREPTPSELTPPSTHTPMSKFGSLTTNEKQKQQKEELDFIASMTFAQGNLRPPSCPCCQ